MRRTALVNSLDSFKTPTRSVNDRLFVSVLSGRKQRLKSPLFFDLSSSSLQWGSKIKTHRDQTIPSEQDEATLVNIKSPLASLSQVRHQVLFESKK